MTSTRIAVITIAHQRHQHLRAQQRVLSRGRLRPDSYVVVAMGDDKLHGWQPQDGLQPEVLPLDVPSAGLPLASARNVGATAALVAGAEVLIFLDVDCLPGQELVVAYLDAVTTQPNVVWSGPVTYLPPPPAGGYELDSLHTLDSPHPARPSPEPGDWSVGGDPDLFWSLSFAMHREAWAQTGGFHPAYVGYGGEDTDFGRVAVRAGLQLGWWGSARAYHQHHPTHSPPRQHLNAILRNGRIFRDRWGTWPMIGWLEAFEREGLVVHTGDDWLPTDSAAQNPDQNGSAAPNAGEAIPSELRESLGKLGTAE